MRTEAQLRAAHINGASFLGKGSAPKHGYFGSATYRTWAAMIQRCTNPARPNYKDYGARGVCVCPDWRKFENFLVDMGERPEGKTIDRYPNKDGNYEPGNCRWATKVEQANNRRPRLK